jgi:uncharacterized protein (TIGR03118 family)
MFRRTIGLLAIASLMAFLGLGGSAAVARTSHAAAMPANAYNVTKLVSDQAGKAMSRDPKLVNAWGLVAGPATPWWVANNGSQSSTLYDKTGTKIPLNVRVAGDPTGAVFNGGSDFVVSNGGVSGPSLFLFDGEGGRIRGWNPTVPAATSTKAFTVVNRSGEGAAFKGLAIASTMHGDFLYATDFANDRVDVFNGMFHQMHWAGAFEDPSLPASYGPFGIQQINGHVFVTFAKHGEDIDEADGAHLGFVDEFNAHGKWLARVASRGALNAPWGIAWAPGNFGRLSGDLLIGNFGDGRINAYAWSHGHWTWDAVLQGKNGRPVAIDGLWALQFGNGSVAGAKNSLFFTAGPDGESHGLFGKIRAA